MGAAKLLNDAQKGETLNHYDYTIAADNTELVPALTNGEVDIATVASNVALNLYNKTNGAVKIIALGTQGVLHILEGSGGTMVESLEDLVGETIYAVGQGANPEYILRYLLQERGLNPDEDVEIVFAQPAEIQAKLISGEIKYAMLPVPAATAAIIKGGGQVRAAVDLTEAWEESSSGRQLIMTAVVARTEFIEKNPEAVQAFLQEYKASIEFVNANVDEAAEMIAGFGITPNAAIAKKAIPQCHLVYIDGRNMSRAISDYFRVLYSVNPASVGGVLPDDAIYYVP
jgi:NitT/TauT family transport system substrate-binding protein